MTMMVSIARVAEVRDGARMVEFNAAHEKMFGKFAATPKTLRDPKDANQIAVVTDVQDLEGLRAATRTPEGDAFMREYGFLEQLSYFLEVQ